MHATINARDIVCLLPVGALESRVSLRWKQPLHAYVMEMAPHFPLLTISSGFSRPLQTGLAHFEVLLMSSTNLRVKQINKMDK